MTAREGFIVLNLSLNYTDGVYKSYFQHVDLDSYSDENTLKMT